MEFVKNPQVTDQRKRIGCQNTRAEPNFREFIGGCGIYIHERVGPQRRGTYASGLHTALCSAALAISSQQTTALKVGLFIATIAVAAVNKFYLTPRLPKPSALRGLRRNSLAEIALGLCVLFFVGALDTLAPTAHRQAVPVGIPPGAAFVHIHAPEAMVDVTINPGRPGKTSLVSRPGMCG